MKMLLKIIPKNVLYAVPCMILTVLLGFAVNMRSRANSIGSFLGEAAGSDVGKVMGSFEALTDYREAYAEGKEEGLSAGDTTLEVADKLRELNRLEVLVAGVKLNDVHSIGEGSNQKYAALYLLKGDAVFTVDFNKAEVSNNENVLSVTLPEPEMELIVDQSKIEKVAEYQKTIWSGSAEDGFDAYLASMVKMTDRAEETLTDYEILMESAKESARRQVEQLVRAVSVSKLDVEIAFQPAKKEE